MSTENGYPPVRESFFDYGGNFNFRRSTFKRWPYQKEDSVCHPVYMSMEWWRSSGDSDVNCVICQKELEGWEENDDPFLEHKKHSKMCPVVVVHTFLNSLPSDVNLENLHNEFDLKKAYLQWVEDIDQINLPESAASSPENAPTTVVQKGKKGRPGKKQTALKTAMSAKNLLAVVENVPVVPIEVPLLSPYPKTQRKQPIRQVKATLKKSAISVPNLITAVKKPVSQTKPTITYDELCSNLEAIVQSVTEKSLVQALLDRVRAAGSIINNPN